MLSFSLVTEPMYIPLVREEEDAENLYTDDFFWLHERGVDLLMVFVFLHFLRKMYMNTMTIEQEVAWKAGALLFLLLVGIIFLGLVLCCTHLSDITLTIAANAFHTFCGFIGKLYWLIFTDQTLNSDTVIRVAYLHYVLAFIMAYFGTYHGVEMHYDWKTEPTFDGISQEISWYDEGLLNEITHAIESFLLMGVLCFYLYVEPEALSYEIFMWGDVGMVVDVRFYGVAPHWYFRPYMAWLITCPYHYAGLIGLVLFFVSFYFQPNVANRNEFGPYASTKTLSWYNTVIVYTLTVQLNWFYQMSYAVFIIAIWYSFSYLPYGRFFNRLGGNVASLCTFVYIFVYLSGTYLRISHYLYRVRAVSL